MQSTIRSIAEAGALLLALAGPAMAMDLSLPGGARLMLERTTDAGSYAVPTGPWTRDGGVPVTRVEGVVAREAWRIDGSELTTLQALAPLRDQLQDAGYEVVFDCASARCGGFDFRFGTEVLPGPQMYVDLTSFRFLSARGPEGDYLTLLVSRSNAAVHIQVIRAGEALTGEEPLRIEDSAPAIEAPLGDVAAQLEKLGHLVLRDVAFQSGSSALAEGAVASLDALADYLMADETRRVMFVGHTDAVGSLETNIALSRDRATAAGGYLRDLGVGAGQVDARGVGFLAPVASNLTEMGREENRRVEVVLLPPPG